MSEKTKGLRNNPEPLKKSFLITEIVAVFYRRETESLPYNVEYICRNGL